MNPLFAQLALAWLRAERVAHPEEWPVDGRPTKDDITVAVDRVYQVLSGEVKRSEASAGDLAIWKSRVNEVPLFIKAWRKDGRPTPTSQDGGVSNNDELLALARLPSGELLDPMNQTTPAPRRRQGQGPQLQGYRERTWWNFYDTWEDIGGNGPDSKQRSMRLFGNRNIGQQFLTNLQVSGQMPGDQTFIIFGVHVSISSVEALAWAADNVGCQLVIGSRQALPFMHVRDLFQGVELVTPKARPLVIPVRQSFQVQVDLRREVPPDLEPFDLTYHMEGLLTRDVV
jgi:hypothetical protein